MKYLKRFNEELKSDTYRNAARKLTKLGHPTRAANLVRWSYISSWKENIKEFSKYGTFDMDILMSKPGTTIENKIFSGKFYLSINFDADPYLDNIEDGIESNKIVFGIGAIPIDEESFEEIELMGKKGSDEFISTEIELYNGFLWTNFIEFDVSSSKVEVHGYSDVKGMFNNRKSAVQFKSLIKDIFEGSDYPSGRTDKNTMKELLMDTICTEGGKSIDEYEDIIKSIGKVSVNNLYKE